MRKLLVASLVLAMAVSTFAQIPRIKVRCPKCGCVGCHSTLRKDTKPQEPTPTTWAAIDYLNFLAVLGVIPPVVKSSPTKLSEVSR